MEALLYVGIALVSLVVSIVVSAVVLVKLPQDYLVAHRPIKFGATMLLRNAAGWLMIVLGIVLSVPGIPGQGLLMILSGLLIVDLPGKHRVLVWLFRKRRVSRAVNRLRLRFGRRPFTMPADVKG